MNDFIPLPLKGLAMARRKQVYEGKAKILYEGPEPRHPDPVLQ